jgi:8-oxo-dGTP diphosphatase
MPELFTIVYEVVNEKKMDKRNFNRRILELGILKKLDKKGKESSRKDAYLYVFEKKNIRSGE